MDNDLVERLRTEMRYEFERIAPPEGFPAFHDIPVGRHISDEFWDLEQEHLWPKVWVLAGRSEDIPGVGDYFLFDDLRQPPIDASNFEMFCRSRRLADDLLIDLQPLFQTGCIA